MGKENGDKIVIGEWKGFKDSDGENIDEAIEMLKVLSYDGKMQELMEMDYYLYLLEGHCSEGAFNKVVADWENDKYE